VKERTPEEREDARRERERRRAAREGRPLPPEPASAVAPGPTRSDAPGAPVPDVASEQPRSDLPAPSRPDAAQPEASDGQRPAAARDAQATQVFDVTTEWREEPAAVVALPTPEAPPPPESEVPLGTRRVARHERVADGGKRGRRRGRLPGPPRGGGGPRATDARRWGRRAGALIAIALVAVVGWFLWSIYQPGAGDGSGRVVVSVPHGASVGQIGDLLADRNVIDSSFFFRLRAKLSGSSGDLKSGTFRLRNDMSYGAALDALSTTPPPPPVIRLSIPEGLSRREIAPRARQTGVRGDYLGASRRSPALDPRRYGAPRGATLEGFLFPATYELRRGATAKQLVASQLRAFKQNLAGVNLRYARSKNLTVFDVLTIASMVEREVMVARERPLVAAVIYNRLKQGIPLGIDATLRFELNDWTHPLKVSQLQADTPYNTRVNGGLPPGPIGNPGLASIKAAAHPAKVGYLFYVVKPGTCGQHAFSSTDAQFERDVQRYNQARDAAGGKSPTTC
jgi:UPF0755 protein